jgi:hypothetical protein
MYTVEIDANPEKVTVPESTSFEAFVAKVAEPLKTMEVARKLPPGPQSL